MAWIYLVGLEGWQPDSKHGFGLSFTVKQIDTAKLFYCHECSLPICSLPQSGMMCEHCEQNTLEYPLISSQVDFLARTSVLQEMESAWKESEAGFSLTSSDSLAIYDHDSFSWKTCQLSLFEALTEFSWSSLRWGMIRDGRLYQPANLEPVIVERDGSYLPTPLAKEGGTNKSKHKNAQRRPQLSTIAKTLPTPMARDWKGSGGKNRQTRNLPRTMGGSLNPRFVEELMGFPIGWTELEDWAMQWYRSKREKRSFA